MKRHAILSLDNIFRYQLSRIWDEEKPNVLFIMFNPSTADSDVDDPTIRRVVQFAKSWDYGGVFVGNLYAYRSTDTKALRTVENPIGTENIEHIQQLVRKTERVVYAWGNHEREPEWLSHCVETPYCIDVSKRGIPKHPLYLKKTLTPKLFVRTGIPKTKAVSKGVPDISDIEYFTNEGTGTGSGRSTNDHNNKIRENIIGSLNTVGEPYFSHPTYGDSWVRLKTGVDTALRTICANYHSYQIQGKAGRRYNYDFLVSFFGVSEKIADEKLEFKYNATKIDDAPQFVSVMKPSQFLSQSFEEYHYDQYLTPLLHQFELEIPERSLYLHSVHSNKPKCIEHAQNLYYQGCKYTSQYTGAEQAVQFYRRSLETSHECIVRFIRETELNIEVLNQYLEKSQDKKNYLLYKNGDFHVQTPTADEYHIVSYTKNPEKSRYEATTKTGKKIKILLRWKNGNGIALPCFQIS
jgi:hypothetical protein